MAVITDRPAGAPCWVDLGTTDVDAAIDFYSTLLGWTVERSGPEFGGYGMASRDGDAVAGIGPINGEYPPSWTVYLATPDVDATLAAAQAAGGQVLAPAMEIGPLGRMAVMADSAMAVVGVWQALEFAGFGRIGETGFLAWADVQSTDVAASRSFLAALFPYESSQPAEAQGPGDYLQHELDGTPVFGSTPAFAAPVSFWMVYFGVDDVEATVAQAQGLGGRLIYGPEETPWGPLATISDPQGAVFSVVGM